MKVSIHANMCDQSTIKIMHALRDPFRDISRDLSRDYGGTMKHLWIDFELIERHAELRPPWSLRFQKKVPGSSKLTGLRMPACENVGHYSVRPDFHALLKVPLESVASYALSLIFASTSVLVDKQKKLGGFDANSFRSDFLSSCKERGYDISAVADSH